MVVGFLGESGFQRDPNDNACMCFAAFSYTYGKPADFYFTGEGEFNRFTYEWCKDYQQKVLGTHLVYVTNDTISQEDLKEKQEQYDWVIRIQGVDQEISGITLQEQYLIEQAECLVVYCDVRMDHYRPAFHALLKNKIVADYDMIRNKLLYQPLNQNVVTRAELDDYDKDLRSSDEFSRDLLLYLHIKQELRKDPEYAKLYDALILYYIKRISCLRNYEHYSFNRCKQYILEELDILAKRCEKTKKLPFFKREVQMFCTYHKKHLAKRKADIDCW